MGDPEYSLAFFSIILPVAYQFNPDLVLVSSGFDAARGDPLGGCKISPEFYGFMTHHLRALANGKVVVVRSSVRPKPLFWFRYDTETQTQNEQYFRADTVTSLNHISKSS